MCETDGIWYRMKSLARHRKYFLNRQWICAALGGALRLSKGALVPISNWERRVSLLSLCALVSSCV